MVNEYAYFGEEIECSTYQGKLGCLREVEAESDSLDELLIASVYDNGVQR